MTPSTTKIDIPKVIELLDAGFRVELYRNQLGTITARSLVYDDKNITDDCTIEQALTRLAYKVLDDEILDND